MKFSILLLTLAFALKLCAQKENITKARFVFSLSAPELLHAGITYRLANISQLGLSAGAGPSLGIVWTSINLEHRLYLGKNDERTNLKTWFFRQGTTFFPSAKSSQQFTLNVPIGKDFPFNKIKNGITIDAGILFTRQRNVICYTCEIIKPLARSSV